MQELLKGIYIHFKGGLYSVIGTAVHTETNETMVIYQSMDNYQVWARPYDMFVDSIDENTKRFAKEYE